MSGSFDFSYSLNIVCLLRNECVFFSFDRVPLCSCMLSEGGRAPPLAAGSVPTSAGLVEGNTEFGSVLAFLFLSVGLALVTVACFFLSHEPPTQKPIKINR